MIAYRSTAEGISAGQLEGFLADWPDPPSPATLLRVLENSDEVVLAIDDGTGAIVGLVTAITDRVLAAYLPLLEVRPEVRGRGIGRELVRRMLGRLGGLYMIDLMCDPELRPFYASLGMRPATGMCVRDYRHQSGVRERGAPPPEGITLDEGA